MSAPKPSNKLPTKDFAQHFNWEEEHVFGMDPLCLVGRDAAARNNAVDVGVEKQVLSPRVQDAEEANLGSQVLWISGHLPKRFHDGEE